MSEIKKETDHPTGIKSTKQEMERRLNVVEEMIVNGFKNNHIRKYFIEKENIQLSQITIDKYVKRIYELWAETKKNIDRDAEIVKAYNVYQACVCGLMSQKKFEGAARVVNYITELYGLKAPQDIRISPSSAIKGFSITVAEENFKKIEEQAGEQAINYMKQRERHEEK